MPCPVPSVPISPWLRALLVAVACALPCTSCAIVGTDKNLAPFYARLSTAGNHDEIEAAGGAILIERDTQTGPVRRSMLRPFVDHTVLPNGGSERWFLYPFGLLRTTREESVGQLLPLFRYHETYGENGGVEQFTFLLFPTIYWAKFADGRTVRAFFPFAGALDNSFTFDRLEFVLWPLYVRSERAGRNRINLLWPIFQIGYGRGGTDFRVWPVFGRSRYEGSYDRWFFLWPFFQVHHNNLKAEDKSLREHKWMAFPLYGFSRQGTYRAHTVLWPFFGFASDSRSDYWSFDGPWPLVRIQRPGTSGTARRTRFWPAYGRFDDTDVKIRTFAWPFAGRQRDVTDRGIRKLHWFIPFWHSWDERGEFGRDSVDKIWPLYQVVRQGERRRLGIVALSPLWYLPKFEERWSWLWELYVDERGNGMKRERSWLGLWRREKDQDEDRKYLSGLWANREYTWRGEKVSETSFLFGLIRYRRSKSKGLEWMPPGMPGPGWPRERIPNSILRATPQNGGGE